MIVLRLAAIVAACLTIILNASHGFQTTTVFPYAVLLAVLNATLDLAKCSCLVGMSRAWHNGRRIAAFLLFLLFWPLLANSLWCGLSEIAIVRNESTAERNRDNDTATRVLAEHKRLTDTLNILRANSLFEESSACALPKTKAARTLCKTVEDTQGSLKELEGQLAQTTIQDAQPHITWLANMTQWPIPNVQFGLALWPILLAELVGSLGFYLTRSMPAKATQTRTGWFSKLRRSPPANSAENVSMAVLVTQESKPKIAPVTTSAAPPRLTWPPLPTT